MEYDCRKVLDYQHERERLCNSSTVECSNCPIGGEIHNIYCHVVTQEKIDKLQKWSDEHPEKKVIDTTKYKKALKDIKESGIALGAGDFVEVESLKIAVEAIENILEEVQNE